MSQVLKLEFDPVNPEWVGFHFAHNERMLSHIQYGIKPASYRRWNPEKKRWEVHRNKFLASVGMGKRFFNHVDYSGLPEGFQILIVKFLKDHAGGSPGGPGAPQSEDPYQVLHLLPSAPWSVVQAVYKVLAFESHPDRGGDQNLFLRIDAAFHQLKRARESREVSSG